MRSFLAVIVPLVAIDALWLGVVARSFYRVRIGFLMADNIQWWAVVAFYLLFGAGLWVFVVQPNLTLPLVRVFLLGALFGLVAYGTYDLTNQATIRSWPLAVTLVDLAWGSVMSGIVALIAVRILR